MPKFDSDNFDSVVAAINSKYEGELRMGDSYEHPERLSSRSLALDFAMGGGVPKGRIVRLYGPYSSTKTLTGFNIIAEGQQEGLICCYWNIEKSYDPEFVEENCGVDTSELLVMEGTTIEGIGDKLESLMGVVNLHVIDSCSAAVSIDELNAKVEDWRPGIGARAWGKVFRRLNERFDHMENTIVLLDQVRTNFKTSTEDPPGGRILDHASSMSVKFKKGSWLQRNAHGNLVAPKKGGVRGTSDMNDMEQPPGIEINCRVEKSRVCRPLTPAAMRLDLEAIRFDRTFELMEAAKAFGVVEVRGGGNYYFPAVAKNGKKQERLYGEDALRAFIDLHPPVQNEIRREAMRIARQR